MNVVEQWWPCLAVATLVSLGCFVSSIVPPEGSSLRQVLGQRFMVPLTRRGLLWAGVPPVIWTLLFHALVWTVWRSLGRWPEFGEATDDWGGLVRILVNVVGWTGLAFVFSIYGLPIVLVASLCRSRWNHVAVYTLLHAAMLGLAFGSVLLAPAAFLNWLFD